MPYSGNWVGRVSEVALHRARLVLGWVTVIGEHTKHPGQLSFLSSVGQERNTGQIALLKRLRDYYFELR